MEQSFGTCYGPKENIKSLNAFLDNLQAEAYEVHRYLYENDCIPLLPKAALLKEIFKPPGLCE